MRKPITTALFAFFALAAIAGIECRAEEKLSAENIELNTTNPLVATMSLSNKAFTIPAAPRHMLDYGDVTEMYFLPGRKMAKNLYPRPKGPLCRVEFMERDTPTRVSSNLKFNDVRIQKNQYIKGVIQIYGIWIDDIERTFLCERDDEKPWTLADLRAIFGKKSISVTASAAAEDEARVKTAPAPKVTEVAPVDSKDSTKRDAQ